MNRIRFKLQNAAILTAAIVLGLSACRKDSPGSPDTPVEVEMQNTVLTGTVRSASGAPLGGVQVVSGDISTVTANDGTFSLEQAATVNRRAVIRFDRQGYFSVTRSGVWADEMHIETVMQAKGNGSNTAAASFGANEAKTLSAGGMKVDIPASSLVRADGSAYTGSVNADMLYLDPNNADFAELMPGGDLAGVRTDNSETQLISYGMTEVSLTDNAGNALQLKAGAVSELTFPIPAGMENSPPATIPLWSFDGERGIWIEEGTAMLRGNEYVGTVNHFSWHNLDVPADRVTVKGRVTDCENNPAAYVKVTVEQTAAATNSKGEYSVFVPANTPVAVVVKSSDYGNYSPEVSHSVPGKTGGSVVTQNISLPCRTQEPGDGSVFSVDKASITYLVSGGGELIITFDNFGRRLRMDMNYGTDEHTVIIFDELSRTYTVGIPGMWMDYPFEGTSSGALFGGFIYDEALYANIPGFAALPDETVAGKSCKMFSFTEDGCTAKIGTWNGLLMLAEDCEEGVTMIATAVSLDVPSNAFTKTMNIF